MLLVTTGRVLSRGRARLGGTGTVLSALTAPSALPSQALVIAGISLQAANLYGYILCKMGGESDISRVTASLLSQTVFQTVSH